MALLSVQSIVPSGVVPTANAVSASDTFVNDGRTLMEVNNGGATSLTVTVSSPIQCNQGFTHDLSITIAAGETKIIGPFVQSRFNDPSTGLVTVGFSVTTSITAKVFKF